MKILVIGASVMIGKPVTRELAKAGFTLTLLARDVRKMRELFPGIRVVEGDVLDPLSLVKAFEDAVLLQQRLPYSIRVSQLVIGLFHAIHKLILI